MTQDGNTADPKKVLSDDEIARAVADLDGWSHNEGALTVTAVCESPTRAIDLVAAIGQAANAQNHHPDVLWSYTEVTLDMASHDVGGITSRDLELARTVTALMQEYEAEPMGL